MLHNLSIKNYALIDKLDVSFSQGFTCITGETGAGKSILLGGLSLVLGKRADLSTLRNKAEKCIIEGEFVIGKYKLKPFFTANDLDYEDKTIIRREILPSGKSRAFVNDTPVTLDVLSNLGSRLIDVHSQYQTLKLAEHEFQFKVIDSLAHNLDRLQIYSNGLSAYQKTSKELKALVEYQGNAIKEHEYNSFLLNELVEAHLQEGAIDELEEKHRQLSNVETIVDSLSKAHGLLNDEQQGVLHLMSELKQNIARISGYGQTYESLSHRLQSAFIEIDDLSSEIQQLLEQTEVDPKSLEEVNGKLGTLYDLQKKHGVQEISALIEIREGLAAKVDALENLDASISEKEAVLADQERELLKLSKSITEARLKAIPKLTSQLERSLTLLGMPNARFNIELSQASSFKSNGRDELSFLFSANKGGAFGPMKKVASGGELSRIMLVIKSILANYENLPTMMFDEIDSGVSGEISNRMGDIMHKMSTTMQIFAITHLPQVASKGDHHFKVYKVDEDDTTHTKMKELSQDERVVELAEMLGGKDLTDSAMAHARQLLN